MAIQITAVHLSGGVGHERIVHLWWINPIDSTSGDSTRAQIVKWIEDNGKAYVEDQSSRRVDVGVVEPASGEKYLRTYADGVWKDNLLAVPRL